MSIFFGVSKLPPRGLGGGVIQSVNFTTQQVGNDLILSGKIASASAAQATIRVFRNATFLANAVIDTATGNWTYTIPNAVGENVLAVTLTVPVKSPDKTVTIYRPIEINGALPSGRQDESFVFEPVISYGSGTRRFTISGALPTGLSFSATTGTITGTPRASGTFNNIAITVRDDTGSATLSNLSTTIAAKATSASIFGFERPATEPNPFADLLTTVDQAEIVDTSIWSRQSNDANLTFANGKAQASGAQTAARFFLQTPTARPATGRRLGTITYIDSTTGNVSIGCNNGTSSITGGKTRAARWMSSVTVVDGSLPIGPRATIASGVVASIESIHTFDVDAMLAKKWFLIFLISQSNFVGNSATLDPALDIPAYGCLAIPGAGNTSNGWTMDADGNGIPALCVDPVMHTLLNTGGGPTGAFMRELRKHIPADFTPIFVATGVNGSSFSSNAGQWNKDGTAPTGYANFFKQTRSAWTKAPAGSVVGGLIFCQGESDVGSGSTATWDQRAPALIEEVQNEPGWNAPKGSTTTHGRIPVVFSEIGYNMDPAVMDAASIQNTQRMIDTQRKYDSASGDAKALPRCKYVPRPPNAQFETDNTHFVQATNRVRGYDVAQALVSLIYPTPASSQTFARSFSSEFA